MLIVTKPCLELQQVADAVRTSNKIVVLTGAGISTSCGIPDFRSPGGLQGKTVRELLNSLHESLVTRTDEEGHVEFQCFTDGASDGIDEKVLNATSTELFQATSLESYSWSVATYRTYALLKEFIIQNVHTVSKIHRLFGDLRAGGQLLHWYTQNVDGLEAMTGCSLYTGQDGAFDVIQLHGGLATARCRGFNHTVAWDGEVNRAFMTHVDYRCPKCIGQLRSGRRTQPSSLRPGVVYYGEEVPHSDLIQETIKSDLRHKPELLLIAGTSLVIPGAVQLVKDFTKGLKRPRLGREVIMIGNTLPSTDLHRFIDVFIQMDVEDFATEVWTSELGKNRAENGTIQIRDDAAELLNLMELTYN